MEKKYITLFEIEDAVQKLHNFSDNSYVYATLVGIMSAHLTDEQVEKIYAELKNELDIKEMSDELKYEMEAGK